jgi:outer membrane lipoprotein-sorting protein
MPRGSLQPALLCSAVFVAFVGGVGAVGAVWADDLGPTNTLPSDPALLSGRQIYQRVLDNNFVSFIQESSLISGDRGGNAQESRFKMWFQDLRVHDRVQKRGEVVARSMVQYTHPFDIRFSGYLVLSKLDKANDQFVYMASQRRVKRVNLRGEPVFGSDFSFEDILPREIEDAEYTRLADERAQEADCFVVAAIPKAHMLSEYSRMQVYVDKQRFVPLLTRYWDDRRIEVKELKADPSQIELIDDVWVTKRVTMRHLKHQSFTTLELRKIEPNPELPETTFELRRLESH